MAKVAKKKRKKVKKRVVKKREKTRGGFKPGQSGNPKGRPLGARGRIAVEAREAAASIVDDPLYLKNLRKRARAGVLPSQIECMLWYYAKGKPPEVIQSSGPDGGPIQHVTRDLSNWSPKDFENAKHLARKLDVDRGD